ncbi:MAG: coenzyme F390 synthetase [Alphaproteobacteria bacterium]|nr:MAG: coenzyme F390 synthetase [Alphaproteobacteria bacterium]
MTTAYGAPKSESAFSLLLDARKAMRKGAAAIAQRQRARLAEAVAHARAHSPFYRELYRDRPERIEDVSHLPVTDKKQLMDRFDDWVTDPDVTIEKARAFAENVDLLGERFLDRYTLSTTSGTTGTRGIFLMDDRAMAVTQAVFYRMLSSWLGVGDLIKVLLGGGRMSMVVATGGHFASAVAAARLRKGSAARAKAIQVLSVHMPIAELVERLNQHRPVLVAPYASLAALLADEREAGRLRINPALLALSAEGLPEREYGRIAQAFKCKVGNSYAATEVTFLSYSCEHHWLHVNADWVVLEPVDADYRPVEPGVHSHTVLVSNLANRIQPILRYDLGDSVLMRPDPCPCGNPLPAIKVQGRSAEVLYLANERGERVALAPLLFGTITDRTPGVERFQLVQASPTELRARLLAVAGESREFVWRAVRGQINNVLAAHGLGHVRVELDGDLPQQSPGGKYRQVIPLGSEREPRRML